MQRGRRFVMKKNNFLSADDIMIITYARETYDGSLAFDMRFGSHLHAHSFL